MTDARPHRAYLDGLPVGDRLEVDPDGLVGWSIFPFELEGLRARVLEPPVLPEPSAVPAVVTLNPRTHHDLADLPAALAADLGPLLQRVERAVMAVPGTGRVHVNKWGDGGAHLHVFAFARPVGMQQLRGSCLVLWDDLLPALDHDTWRTNLGIIAASMTAGGGRDLT